MSPPATPWELVQMRAWQTAWDLVCVYGKLERDRGHLVPRERARRAALYAALRWLAGRCRHLRGAEVDDGGPGG